MRSLVRLLFVSLATAAPTLYAADPTPLRQHELIRLVRQDCGSCHGMTLKGGLGPALTPEALRDKPADGLAVTILAGRPGSAMPPWRDFVSQAEAAWIVEQLQKGTVDAR